ncbi:hypothetical protein [Streptomyces gardneri]|uniref:Uncharacterized protein n=1 Tax=Streptomyces gardneri TaxID=66892 RepID=A0A4Y3RS86_9ACTN|nr:hypothetical protein [Streptomyces gardneri]GEB58750.1 hypothetical protein SGA01_43550 [Streptomyces gardneri]GHH07269.1 hypothetical protein GCM10017674_48560 [Streptomyces gardneri]
MPPPVEEEQVPPPVEEEQVPPTVDEQVPPVEEQVPPEEEQVPPEEEQYNPDQGEEQNPADEEVNPDGQQGVLPAEGEEAPPAQNVAIQTLTAGELKQAQDNLAATNLSAAEKAKVKKQLDDLQAIINGNGSQQQKDEAKALAKGLAEALRLSKDADFPKEDRERYAKLVLGVTTALEKVNGTGSVAERLVYFKVLQDLNTVLTKLTDKNLTVQEKVLYSKYADVLLGGVLAAQQPGTAPTKPEDKKKLQEKLQKNAAALKVYQSADSSPEQRAEAKATLDEQARSVTDAKYLELVEELKRLKAPQACLDVVQTRTQQAGWPDGSLWGLTDKSCEDTVKAGAADSSSDWAALFECIVNEPFSTCPARIPE